MATVLNHWTSNLCTLFTAHIQTKQALLQNVIICVTHQIKVTLIGRFHSRRVTFVWLLCNPNAATSSNNAWSYAVLNPQVVKPFPRQTLTGVTLNGASNHGRFFALPFMLRQTAASTCCQVQSAWVGMRFWLQVSSVCCRVHHSAVFATTLEI